MSREPANDHWQAMRPKREELENRPTVRIEVNLRIWHHLDKLKQPVNNRLQYLRKTATKRRKLIAEGSENAWNETLPIKNIIDGLIKSNGDRRENSIEKTSNDMNDTENRVKCCSQYQ